MDKPQNIPQKANQPSLFSLLKPYSALIGVLIVLALLSNGLNLWLPIIISHGIDAFLKSFLSHAKYSSSTIILEFSIATALIFILTYLQSIVQTYSSEKVARDLRKKLSAKISVHSYTFVQKTTAGKLLTNLTSDIDSIKNFVAQAIVSIVSSLFIIIGASILLIRINWKLGLSVLIIVPIIGGTFFVVLSKVRVLFKKTREIIDRLNKVINESILGSSLIRVLNSQQPEYEKFISTNTEAKNLGLQILKLFAGMIPIITFCANLAVLIILTLGGHLVISGQLSLGNFAAFNSYLAILIFPILVIGFMSNIIAQAQASYARILEVLDAPEAENNGTIKAKLLGNLKTEKINLNYGEKSILKDISFEIKAKTKTAIIGPTAAGKTQLLNLLIGLISPTSGQITYDNTEIKNYDEISLHEQIGLVFQDSIIFNISLRENIAFNTSVSEADFNRAIETAELHDFIENLPTKLETVVSERGSTLSGGQKQRIMLARALALNPKILFLDDFTARVDGETEKKILKNISKNYPDLTLLSVTQKISSIEHYNQIIVLMEGEIIAIGTHEHLLTTTPEYVQIYESQQSTNKYE